MSIGGIFWRQHSASSTIAYVTRLAGWDGGFQLENRKSWPRIEGVVPHPFLPGPLNRLLAPNHITFITSPRCIRFLDDAGVSFPTPLKSASPLRPPQGCHLKFLSLSTGTYLCADGQPCICDQALPSVGVPHIVAVIRLTRGLDADKTGYPPTSSHRSLCTHPAPTLLFTWCTLQRSGIASSTRHSHRLHQVVNSQRLRSGTPVGSLIVGPYPEAST